MKKIAIVLFVAATALAGCGKKNPPAAPAESTEGAPAEGAPEEGAPAEGEAGGEAGGEGGGDAGGGEEGGM